MESTTATDLQWAFCKSCNTMFRMPEGFGIDFQQIVPRIAPVEYLKNRRRADRQYLQHDCGNYLRGTVIVAKHSDKIVCNEKCQSATRPVCECSCDGENHGA